MASPTPVEAEDEVVAARGRQEALDRRRWRRALLAAAAVHLALLAAPRPRSELAPSAAPGEVRAYPLTTLRPAPPALPEPVVPEPPDDEEPPAVTEEEPAPPGPPPPPRVEVLFPQGELSRLAPPRPLDAVPPPSPDGAPPEGGEVRIYLQLDERGEVYGVRAAAGDPALLDAALAAAESWRFFPATLDGAAIPVVVEVIVRFPPQPTTAGAEPGSG